MTGDKIKQALAERILILDGGMGTMIQELGLTESDYRGDKWTEHTILQRGNNDLLNITLPDAIGNIHRQYLDAGADIFTTNTFNANAISMEDYGMQSFVSEINVAAGKLARTVADDYMRTHPDRTIFVAGSLGPTNKTASMSPDVNDPAYRAVTYIDLYRAYYEQVDALIAGGVDLILYETIFDTLNVKAGIDAVLQVMSDRKCELPIMLSLTLSGKGGRTFSGQTIEAFLTSISHAPLLSIGLNCSFGASEMKPYLREIALVAPFFISAHPNAGLPNRFGQYDETPDKMAMQIKEFIDEGLVNIIGGCCGTTPAHIAQYPELIKDATPHRPASQHTTLQLSGLERLDIKPENNFVNIGERCNVAGSRKFLRLIKEKNYEEALTIARKQVDDGAQVIDINMDDGLLDASHEMKTFLNLIASEPDIARVPIMIDSSKWDVIEQGLMCVQGKSIVNSISLKEGERVFLERAARIRRLGAAVVVMAFDEQGQADIYERKIEVCERAYLLLTKQAGFPPQDIIFDPNVLAIATGMSEHDGYGLDFIRAIGWIKQHLPHARVSGGVSNLSFSFRGNDYIREAMHAVFLYHAIRAGMDMGIVNPASSVIYEDIELSLRNLLEDVVLARRSEAPDELINYVQENIERLSGKRGVVTENARGIQDKKTDVWRTLPIAARLEHALIKGIGDYLETDLNEALLQYDRVVDIIDGPLMSGMNKVGELFGAGKMFLPQVVKTARTMKKAVAILQPAIEAEKTRQGATVEKAAKAGKIVFATVKGDVHDIGKNIVSIVLSCNNYEVIDLGVMVPAEKIIQTLRDEKPDLLGLSGLITPSLEEMTHVVSEMQKAGFNIPVLIGGATTSKLHTALKIAPHYDYPVVHVVDASQNPVIAAQLLNPVTREKYIGELNNEYASLRMQQSGAASTGRLLSLTEARARRLTTDWQNYHPFAPTQRGVQQIALPIAELIPYINWTFFFVAWRLNGRYANLSRLHDCDACRAQWINEKPETERAKAQEALNLYTDARRLLQQMSTAACKARYGFFPAVSASDDTIRIGTEIFPVLRQQALSENDICLSLADYVMPASEGRDDYIGAFAVTVGDAMTPLCRQYEQDNYNLMLIQTLSDRLAEAAAEYLHEKVRKEYWGYADNEKLSVDELFKARYQGIRPAIGYPSLPDQGLIFTIDKLLSFNQTGISLTENGALSPLSSIVGLYFAHPAASYFMIGQITDEQLVDYAARRHESVDHLRKFLIKNLT